MYFQWHGRFVWVDEELLDEPTVSADLQRWKFRLVYFQVTTLRYLWGPAWIAFWLAPLLRLRDAVARRWFRCYRRFGHSRPGEHLPWPSWLKLGW